MIYLILIHIQPISGKLSTLFGAQYIVPLQLSAPHQLAMYLPLMWSLFNKGFVVFNFVSQA